MPTVNTDWVHNYIELMLADNPECVYRPRLPPYSGAIFPPCSRGNSGHAKSVDSYCFERSKI